MSGALAAELIADSGAAATEDDFFRSAEFLAAEGTTHTLLIDSPGDALAAPLVVREIPGGGIDATSPYGYPGLAGETSEAIDPAALDLAPTGLVSVFIRHRLGPPPLAGAERRGKVQIADPELPRKSRASDRQQVRRNERDGYEVSFCEGRAVGERELAGFLAAYEQTMVRTAAARRYFFGRDYFERILGSERSSLFWVSDPEGEIAAASIATESDGMLHYYLSGTADSQVTAAPMKNLVSAMVDHSEERGLPLNLGGGLAPGDGLEEFKRGFANREEPFWASPLIGDAEAYARLSAGREDGDYFPAYRSP